MEIKVQDQPLSAKTGELPAGDLPHAMEQAVRKGAIEAEIEFIEEIGENTKASVEKAKEAGAEPPKEAVASKDRASLSDESAYYKERENGIPAPDQMWKEEAGQAWESLKSWTPFAEKKIEDELEHLAAVYKELLLAILEHPAGEVRENQLSALDQLLPDLLAKLLDARLGELVALLQNFGSQNARNSLRAALYHSVTGNALSERELEQVFKGILKGADAVGEGQGGIRIPVNKAENQGEQGIIYQPAGDGRIKNDAGYSRRMLREAYISVIDGKNRKGADNEKVFGAQASISPMAEKAIYSPGDLALAERFAFYMNQSGNLLGAAALSGESEELYGFLAAIMAIKAHIFGTFSGIDQRLASDLREAIDRMIDFYIQEQYQKTADRSRGFEGRYQVFQPKDAYKVFYYLMNLYQTTRDLQETANKGIRHAYRQFLKKKESMREAGESSFFFSRTKKDAIEDWKDGKRYVEQDFKEFQAFLSGQNQNELPFGVLELSPWGMFAEPEIRSVRGKAPAFPALLMGGTVLFLFLLLVFVFL